MFRPMLAVAADVATLRYPVLASPKVDGIRALVRNGQLLSRKLLPIPNMDLAARFGKPEYEGFDGELVLGFPWAATVFETGSVVMEADYPGNGIEFLVFDLCNVAGTYKERYKELLVKTEHLLHESHPMLWAHQLIFDQEELLAYVAGVTDKGYEGAIVRDLNGPYKHGRSTLREGWMLKIKNFSDAEAIVIGMEELMHNDNVATLNDLGLTKRSSHQENKRASGMMGALICLYNGQEIRIGTGFTREQRVEIFNNFDKYLKQYAKFKYQTTGGKSIATGGKGIRPPYVFLSWRHALDMGEPSVERVT